MKEILHRMPATMLAALLLVVVPAASTRSADLAAGQSAFAKCKICHTLATGAPSAVGPNLHGLFGRKAGSLANFDYSRAMKTSGVTWDDDTLAKYLRAPKGFIPGNQMAFPGIKDEKELSHLIAYLKQVTK